MEEGFCIHRARSYTEICQVFQGAPWCSREGLSLESCLCTKLLGNNQDRAPDLNRPYGVVRSHQWCWFALSVTKIYVMVAWSHIHTYLVLKHWDTVCSY